MGPVIKPFLIMCTCLALVPLCFRLTGWQWWPEQKIPGGVMLYWATETVSQPWGIVTHLLLCTLFCFLLRLSGRQAILLVVILTVVVTGGQGIAGLIKPMVHEPRPFIVWLEQQYALSVSTFYHLSPSAQGEWIAVYLPKNVVLPEWLIQHWQQQTGYAFPSGHTLFAACWALLAAGILWSHKHHVTVVVIGIWAVLVMISRLLLGMHWTQDLFASVVVSVLLSSVGIWIGSRFIARNC